MEVNKIRVHFSNRKFHCRDAEGAEKSISILSYPSPGNYSFAEFHAYRIQALLKIAVF
jgi:hypothetical protein